MRTRPQDVGQRLLVERHGQEVVGVESRHAGPAQVVGHPAGVDGPGQVLELLEVVEVEGVGAADGEGDAVHDDGVAFGHLFEDVAGPAAGVHEVLGDGLEPVHLGLVLAGCGRSGRCAGRLRVRGWRSRDAAAAWLFSSPEREAKRPRRTHGRSPGEKANRQGLLVLGRRARRYFLSGKAFFMSASKLERALAQVFASLIGTAQPPMPLHLFSPGVLLALQPPRPAQSLSPRRCGPWPWRSRPGRRSRSCRLRSCPCRCSGRGRRAAPGPSAACPDPSFPARRPRRGPRSIRPPGRPGRPLPIW